MTLLALAAFLLIASMALVALRALVGPSLFDRVLAGNAFGSNTVMLIAVIAVAVDNDMFLDIALIYGLINFIATIALQKAITCKDLGNGREEESL